MNKTLKKLEIAVKRMTLRQWAIVVSCAFVLSMIYQWNQLDTKDARQARVKSIAIEREQTRQRDAEMLRKSRVVIRQVLSIEGIDREMRGMIAAARARGGDVSVDSGHAERKYDDWWKVSFHAFVDGSSVGSFEWNYNVTTKKLVPVSMLAQSISPWIEQ